MLLNTATEELAHIEMLSTAVALNLENAPLSLQEEVSADAVGGSVLNGMNFRHILSTGLAALPENSNGVPFNASHVYASGNLAADMMANVTAESSGRILAVRLYNMTDDPGMKDMLSFLIARDTMHQQQWLAAIEDMGGLDASLPIPNSFPQEQEQQDVSYAFVNCFVEGNDPPEGRCRAAPRWTARASSR
jgi:Mn-containing catalase